MVSSLTKLHMFSRRLLSRPLPGMAFCSAQTLAAEQQGSVAASSPDPNVLRRAAEVLQQINELLSRNEEVLKQQALAEDQHVFFKIADYQHLIEQGLVPRKQLRAFVFSLNKKVKEEKRGYPTRLTPEQMLEVLQRPSWIKRQRLLRYLSEKEAKDDRKKNPKSRPVYSERLSSTWTSSTKMEYSLHKNCIFIRLGKAFCYTTLEKRMVYHMPFAQKIALDFAYDHLMSAREANKVSRDVEKLYTLNRYSSTPLNIHFCSFDTESAHSARLVRDLTTHRKVPPPCEMTTKSVVELFPRESVIYLSPEGDEVLDKIDNDYVYVLGALVDKVNKPGVSAERAKELGVRSMRFPGDIFLRWEERQKPLHLTQCARIISKLANGCSWKDAVKGIEKSFVVEL